MHACKLLCYILLPLFVLISCGPEKPNAGQVDDFIEQLILRMDMTRHSYENFVNNIPEKHDGLSRGMIVTIYDLMYTQMKRERPLAEEVMPFEADDFARKKSLALKQAALTVIDTYIEGASTELSEIKTLISEGKTINSVEVQNLFLIFEGRLQSAYDAFGKIQQELANAYAITLY